MVSYAKFILMTVGDEFRSIIFALQFYGGSAVPTLGLSYKCDKMSKYLFYLMSSKTVCGCLT